MSAPNPFPVHEDDAHRALHHAEGDGTEEQQDHDPDRANHVPVGDEGAHLLRHGPCRTGRHELHVAPHGREQRLLLDEMREPDEQQRKQGNDGEQGVVGDGPGEQQPLVALEAEQRPQQERPGPPEDEEGAIPGRHHAQRGLQGP